MSPSSVPHLPPIPLPGSDRWTQTLTRIASQPLELAPDFPAVARRHEAWWNHDLIDRPLFLYRKSLDPVRSFGRRLDLLNQPDRWLEVTRADLAATAFLGDELPNIRVDFGPVLLGPLLGARTEFRSDTAWTHSFINDDWSNLPPWRIDDDNPFWLLLGKLLDAVARDARGRYLLRTPDLGGSADVLLNLRGSEPLCLDVLDRPDLVSSAVDHLFPLWHRAFVEIYHRTLAQGAGLVHWISLWSNRPYVVPACDFSFMIGPRQFNSIFLPDLARQVESVGRAVFHLDGPGATSHLDALLDLPNLTAVQYVPGAGSPSALPWIDLFRKIQSRGRSVLVLCPPDEVLTVLDLLQPEGLAFQPIEGPGWDHIDDIFKTLCSRFGCPPLRVS